MVLFGGVAALLLWLVFSGLRRFGREGRIVAIFLLASVLVLGGGGAWFAMHLNAKANVSYSSNRRPEKSMSVSWDFSDWVGLSLLLAVTCGLVTGSDPLAIVQLLVRSPRRGKRKSN